jgi:hypothetical protein
MNDVYKDIVIQASSRCRQIGQNEAWLWERTLTELLLKEVIDVIESDRVSGMPGSTEYDLGMLRSIAMVKQHFGLDS